MSESERIYSSAQVAKLLDLSGGMVRRYSLALERLTGEAIPQDPRDGRQFSERHLQTLQAARRFVLGHRGLSVEEGIRRALGLAEEPTELPLNPSVMTGGAEVARVFAEALQRYGEPLLTEVRTLRESNEDMARELAALRREVGEMRALPPSGTEVEPSSVKVVEPQRREQQEWISETSRRGSGVGVRRPTDGGDEDSTFIRLARRLEGLLRRR